MIVFTTVLLILSILSLKVDGSSETANTEHCERLQQYTDTRIALLSVMSLNNSSSTLLMITTEQLVYELPLEHRFLDATLNLSNYSPVALKQKWPSMKRRVPQSRWLSLVDEEGNQWLLLNDQLQERELNCTLFSIQTRKVESRFFAIKSKTDSLQLASGRWLSTAEASHFYVLNNVTLTLLKVAVDFQTNSIQSVGEPLQLCKHSDTFLGAEQLLLLPESNASSSFAQCNYRLNWTLPSNTLEGAPAGAFSDGKWFVVLGNQSVYLFDAIAVTKPGTVVFVTRLNYSQFIICSERNTNGIPSLHKLLSLVAIFFIFVIIIGMAFFHVYLLQYDAFQKTPTPIEKEVKTKPIKKTNGTTEIIKRVDTPDCKECKEKIETRKIRAS